MSFHCSSSPINESLVLVLDLLLSYLDHALKLLVHSFFFAIPSPSPLSLFGTQEECEPSFRTYRGFGIIVVQCQAWS